MTASPRVVVKELSSSLLDMKFMLKKKKQLEAKAAKKKQEKLENKIAEHEGEATSSKSIPVVAESKYEICNDYAKLENLLFGRLSFGGFNKEVEVLMEYYERRRNGEISDNEEDEGKDVNDEEMAESLGGKKLAALDKKAQSKRERRQQNEKNEEGLAGRRFDIKDIRKRFAGGDMEGAPERKFLKPMDD